MSIVVKVVCDWCDTNSEGISGASRSNGIKAREAARRDGWIRRFDRDFCPGCAEVPPAVMRAKLRASAARTAREAAP